MNSLVFSLAIWQKGAYGGGGGDHLITGVLQRFALAGYTKGQIQSLTGTSLPLKMEEAVGL
jgi:hypothetical protein